MGELSNLVLCGSCKTGRMIEFYEGLPRHVQKVVKSVTKIQRRKFLRYGIVPVPVLEAMWLLGWLPGDKFPRRGMKILDLTEYLRKGGYNQEGYKSPQAEENGKWLWKTIVKEEVIGRRTFVKKEKMPAMKIKHDSRTKPSAINSKAAV